MKRPLNLCRTRNFVRELFSLPTKIPNHFCRYPKILVEPGLRGAGFYGTPGGLPRGLVVIPDVRSAGQAGTKKFSPWRWPCKVLMEDNRNRKRKKSSRSEEEKEAQKDQRRVEKYQECAGEAKTVPLLCSSSLTHQPAVVCSWQECKLLKQQYTTQKRTAQEQTDARKVEFLRSVSVFKRQVRSTPCVLSLVLEILHRAAHYRWTRTLRNLRRSRSSRTSE